MYLALKPYFANEEDREHLHYFDAPYAVKNLADANRFRSKLHRALYNLHKYVLVASHDIFLTHIVAKEIAPESSCLYIRILMTRLAISFGGTGLPQARSQKCE